jgi:hypothetical protein
MSSTGSTDDKGPTSESIALIDDSDLVAFASPARNSESKVRFAIDDNSDLVAFSYPRESSPPEHRKSVARNTVVTSVAALGLGFIIGKMLR